MKGANYGPYERKSEQCVKKENRKKNVVEERQDVFMLRATPVVQSLGLGTPRWRQGPLTGERCFEGTRVLGTYRFSSTTAILHKFFISSELAPVMLRQWRM